MDCGSPIGTAFVVLFLIIFQVTAINLFIAFIINGFQMVKEEENL